MAGGGTGYAALDAHVGMLHQMLVEGMYHSGTDIHNWEGGTATEANHPIPYAHGDTAIEIPAVPARTPTAYKDNPSILRFIKERGQTDVGGNPLQGREAFSPDELMEAVQERYEDFLSIVEGLDPETDWQRFLTVASGLKTTAYPELDTDVLIQAAFNSAINKATVEMKEAKREASEQALDEVSDAKDAAVLDVEAMMPAISARARMDASLIVGDSSTKGNEVASTTLDNAKSKADSILSADITFSKAQGNTNALDNSVREQAKTNMLDILGNVSPNVETLITKALMNSKMQASGLVTSAVQLAIESFEGSMVDNAVSSYRSRALRNHLKGVNAFTSGMSDINAVMSSSFVLGLGAMESDFTRDVNDFRSKLEIQIYAQTISAFLTSFGACYTSYLNSYEKRQTEYLELYRQSCSQYVQTFLGLVSSHLQTYLKSFGDYLTSSIGASTDYNRQVEFEKQVEIQTMQSLTGVELDTFNRLYMEGMGSMRNVLDTHLRNTVTAGLQERVSGLDFMKDAVGGLTRHMINRHTLEGDSSKVLTEINRIRTVLKSEEEQRNAEYDVLEATWDMDLFQQGANIISAMAGSVVPTQAKPTKTQSAVGGAFSGAAIGAQVGGPAALPAAVGGFLIGGVAGALAG